MAMRKQVHQPLQHLDAAADVSRYAAPVRPFFCCHLAYTV
jgi:hypothetical protein